MTFANSSGSPSQKLSSPIQNSPKFVNENCSPSGLDPHRTRPSRLQLYPDMITRIWILSYWYSSYSWENKWRFFEKRKIFELEEKNLLTCDIICSAVTNGQGSADISRTDQLFLNMAMMIVFPWWRIAMLRDAVVSVFTVWGFINCCSLTWDHLYFTWQCIKLSLVSITVAIWCLFPFHFILFIIIRENNWSRSFTRRRIYFHGKRTRSTGQEWSPLVDICWKFIVCPCRSHLKWSFLDI